ncbi:hypothetical protein AAG906_032986 [Vitis piasezkii]
MCGGDDHLAWKCPSIWRRRGYLVLHALQDWFFILSVDLSSWVREEGRLVRFSKRSDMDEWVVIVDQFTGAMAST